MTRPLRVRALPLLLVVAAGCQDYNFNPVGKCVIQPGNERVTLSNISTADVLFVVDDSGSMAGEQDKLAANFSAFINNLNQTNVARAANGLTPIDFHIAVTSSSVYSNEQYQNSATCRTDCGTAAGTPTCCVAGQPYKIPQSCSGPGAACAAGTTCRSDCAGMKGEYVCCNEATTPPTPVRTQNVACTRVGEACGQLNTHYQFYPGCSTRPGVAVDGWPYPRGEFVAWSPATSTTANPRVLHFDKELYTGGGRNAQGMTQADLISFFTGGTALGRQVSGNIVVGTCGSGQEQALEAAKRAVEKAVTTGQKDTFAPTKDGSGNPVQTWTPATRTATSAATWPHANSKLVLVFVGDEDDCSSPESHDQGVVLLTNQGPGTGVPDACQRDELGARKQFAVEGYVDYFMNLGRPVGAAFIFPATQTSCGEGTSCTAGLCCPPECRAADGTCSEFCGAQAPGFRLLRAANQFRERGADVVVGSICDGNFSALLNKIADLVKPPATLSLPTTPAEGKVTLLRIADTQGVTRKLCKGPAPAGMSTAEATAQGFDWWFVPSDIPAPPSTVSKFVYINHDTGKCEANPGETYSADYLGLMPANGCSATGAAGRSQCQGALGGRAEDWGCYIPPGSAVGTCVCCPAGSTDPACAP